MVPTKMSMHIHLDMRMGERSGHQAMNPNNLPWANSQPTNSRLNISSQNQPWANVPNKTQVIGIRPVIYQSTSSHQNINFWYWRKGKIICWRYLEDNNNKWRFNTRNIAINLQRTYCYKQLCSRNCRRETSNVGKTFLVL